MTDINKNRKLKILGLTGLLLGCSLFIPFPAHVQTMISNTWLIISGDQEWRVASSGIPVGTVVSAPQQGTIWGVLLPSSPARWMYVDNFNTGPMRDPSQYSVRRFTRELGSAFPKSTLKQATLKLTADNGFVVWVCGTRVASTFEPNNVYNNRPIFTADWRNIQTYDVTQAMHGGTNQIVVDVADYGIAAGVLLELYLRFDRAEWIMAGIPL